MIIKDADSRQKDIDTLETLLDHPQAGLDTKKLITQEIKNIRSGVKGEKEAAYEMRMRFKDNRNWFVIHDLRIEVDGSIAQIDHLIINRFMEVYVCESKRFFEGIAINEQMEFSAFYGGKAYGIPSPIEQNKKQVAVLEKLFESGAVELPKRLGLFIKPKYIKCVLVSKHARISRPRKKVNDLDSIVKTDQFISHIEKLYNGNNNPLTVIKLVGSDTLEKLASDLVHQHKPIKFNWAAKFGLPGVVKNTDSTVTKDYPSAREIISPLIEADEGKVEKKLICHSCGTKLSYKVGVFCWNNRKKFGGHAYCLDCQKNNCFKENVSVA